MSAQVVNAWAESGSSFPWTSLIFCHLIAIGSTIMSNGGRGKAPRSMRMSAKIKMAALFLVLGASISLTDSGIAQPPAAQQPAAQQPPDKPAAEPLPAGA